VISSQFFVTPVVLLAPTEMTATTTTKSVTVYWFRNALRLHDNPSLLHAVQESSSHSGTQTLCPLYIVDPKFPFAQTHKRSVGPIRANFVLESLRDLDNSLNGLGSKLFVMRGDPREVLPTVISSLRRCNESGNDDVHINLVYEKECAEPIRAMDSEVLGAVRKLKIPELTIKSFDTHSLFEMEHYLAKCKNGMAPSTMTVFRKLFSSMGDVPTEVETVSACAKAPDLSSTLPANLLSSLSFTKESSSIAGTSLFDVPRLEDLGYDEKSCEMIRKESDCKFIGGEKEAIKLLDQMKQRKRWVADFEKPKTKPNALVPDTTGLSAYVKHGCLSARVFYHALSDIYELYPKHTQPPVSLHGQLLWREFNYLTGYSTPNFDKMVGNPIARQIPWDDDPEVLAAWRDARTGYPFIDAIMTQLKETGWIHHLARHAAACFLTRGDLWQSWERGAEVFEERLIDADWSINNFNWQWLSCTAHFYQYFRCYSPVAFGKKTDPNGDYIRKWLPHLRKLPAKYIYEPWKAPLSVQEACGVVIGTDYPAPIVDHQSVSKGNMGRMKEAYDAHKMSQAGNAASETSRQRTVVSGSGNTTSKRRKRNL